MSTAAVHWASHRKCAVYTTHARLVGNIPTKRRRLLDALHDLHEPLMALHDAEVDMLGEPGTPAKVYPTALVRLSDVVVCHPLEGDDTRPRRTRTVAGIRKEQVISQVLLQASSVLVSGDVHLPPDTTLMAYVTARTNAFLPMTGVRVMWPGGVALVPDALVNTEMVSAFYTQMASFAYLLGHDEPPVRAVERRKQPAAQASSALGRVWVPSTHGGQHAPAHQAAAG